MGKDLAALEKSLITEFRTLIEQRNLSLQGPIRDIQPPSSIILLASKAAAAVLISFERGYRAGHETSN